MMKPRALFLLLSFLIGSNESVALSLRGSSRGLTETHVLCRMYLEETMIESNNGQLQRAEESACAPIVDGQESDDLITFSLPSEIEETNRGLLEEGLLLVNITNALLSNGDIARTPQSEVLVITETPESLRHLQEKENISIGNRTVAIVRILTNDAEPSVSRADLKNLFNESQVNFRTQYDLCSNGQLQWRLSEVGVVDVVLDQPLADFGTRGSTIVRAAQSQLKSDLNLESVKDIADRVMFCVPRSAGKWVASAGMNHWRAQFHDDWCISLTATMHELGHTIGLIHSNEGTEKYGDRTGNMARSFRKPDGPQRCFDGRNNHVLGWYKNRELTFNPLEDEEPRLIKLATYIDYSKAEQDEPVLVSLPGDIFLQYNRAKSFNKGTGEKKDTVTVGQMTENGNDLLNGLKGGDLHEFQNYTGSGESLIVEACHAAPGDNNTPDIMMISVGMGESRCSDLAPSAAPSSSPSESRAPSTSPSISPAPSGSPSNSPSKDPKGYTHVGIQLPMYRPRLQRPYFKNLFS